MLHVLLAYRHVSSQIKPLEVKGQSTEQKCLCRPERLRKWASAWGVCGKRGSLCSKDRDNGAQLVQLYYSHDFLNSQRNVCVFLMFYMLIFLIIAIIFTITE